MRANVALLCALPVLSALLIGYTSTADHARGLGTAAAMVMVVVGGLLLGYALYRRTVRRAAAIELAAILLVAVGSLGQGYRVMTLSLASAAGLGIALGAGACLVGGILLYMRTMLTASRSLPLSH